MPVVAVSYEDQLVTKVAELEGSGCKIIQVVPRGAGWVIIYSRGPGRPPKETRAGAA